MAFDQQRNWDISMAENLHKVLSDARSAREQNVIKVEDNITRCFRGPPIYLPDEIILSIVEYIDQQPEAQKTLAACCRLSHQWYNTTIRLLYEQPKLYGKNYDPFTRTICPSINLHVRKSPLSAFIHHLDLGGLVHQGSKSMTARLLGRTKVNLESFRAPQASFAINCIPALARCSKLKSLDLSLVSESPPLPELLKAVSSLTELRAFRLPRSSGFGSHDGRIPLHWPPNLTELALSGGIDAWFVTGDAKFPDTLNSLTLEHCPWAKTKSVMSFLIGSIRNLSRLEKVKISHMPRFDAQAMDDLLLILPKIKELSISVDYISPNMFEQGSPRRWMLDQALLENNEEPIAHKMRHEHLHTLELTNSGNPNVEDKITPIDLYIAVDDDVLPALRTVRVAKSLLWQKGEASRDAEALADVLQARGQSDWENRVGVFELMSAEVWQRADPTRGAGVWTFDM